MKQSGVTFIELMIALVIAAILASIAIPSYRAWIVNTQIRTAAESMLNGLQLARGEAIRRNANVTFVMTTSNETAWSIICTECYDTNDDITIQQRSADEGEIGSLSSVGTEGVVATTDPANATTITFDAFGRVAANQFDGNGAAATAAIQQIDLSADTNRLAAGQQRPLRIMIGGTRVGRVWMCDPNASATTGGITAC